MTDKIKPTDELPPEQIQKYAELLQAILQGRPFVLVIGQPDTDIVKYTSNQPRREAQGMLEAFLQKWRSQS